MPRIRVRRREQGQLKPQGMQGQGYGKTWGRQVEEGVRQMGSLKLGFMVPSSSLPHSQASSCPGGFGGGKGRTRQARALTSSVQGRPFALALLDEGRGTVGREDLYTLSGASLRGQEERGPAFVVPYVQIHQRLGQRF